MFGNIFNFFFAYTRKTPNIEKMRQQDIHHANDQLAYQAEQEAFKKHINKQHKQAMRKPVTVPLTDRRIAAARGIEFDKDAM